MPNFQVEQLKQLPQRKKETWQGGLIRLPSWTRDDDGNPKRPVAPMWASLQTGLAEMPDVLSTDDAPFDLALDALVRFATGEKAGYRPTKLQVNRPALAEHLTELLSEADIVVEYRDRLLLIDRWLDRMAKEFSDGLPIPPDSLDVKGVTVDRMRAFAEAAKAFYEAAVWEELATEDLLEIVEPLPDIALRYAVVMGSGGREFGLGFYRNPELFWDTLAGKNVFEQMVSAGVWSLSFGDVTEMPFGDVDLWDDHDLPVAGKRAYPVAIHFEPRRMRRPGTEILNFMEGLLRALTASTEEELDSGEWSKEVTTFDGPVTFHLRLPHVLDPPDRQTMATHGRMDRRGMESMSAQISRFLEDKDFADMDEVNAAIAEEFTGKQIDQSKYPPRSAREEAQELCYEAFDAMGRRQKALAKKALAVDPDCADAHVILAENAGSPEKALEHYAAGVEAGRRALGEEFFEENEGYFWGMTETRPFMRAMVGLADCYQALGQYGDAIDLCKEVLRLNPNDNQGVRSFLLPLLITEDRLDEAGDLLAEYKEDISATWKYCDALVTFAKKGKTATAKRKLAKAMEINPHVPPLMLGDRPLPSLPSSYALGSQEEAVCCITECLVAWDAIPGAMDWLQEQAG